MQRNCLSAAIAISLLSAVSCAGARSITDDQSMGGLQLNFANPGARSMAMGGATLAISDDGTAAYTNPAALLNLSSSEVAVEFRHTEFDPKYLVGGSVGNEVEERQSSSTQGLGFFSVAIVRDNFALGVFRSLLADFESKVDRREFDADVGALSPQLSRIDLQVVNTGFSGAFRVSEDFSIGASASMSRFSLRSDSGGSLQTPFFSQRSSGEGTDNSDLVFALGAHWRISSNWSAAFAYRSGGDFDYRVTSQEQLPDSKRAFRVPDTIGLGFGYLSDDSLWRVGLDVNRIKYSRLTDGYSPVDDGSFSNSSAILRVDDVTEVRFGVERYFELNSDWFLSVRGGLWLDPDHEVRASAQPGNTAAAGFCRATRAFDGNTNRNACIQYGRVLESLFPEGDDTVVASFGLGLTNGRQSFNFGVNGASRLQTISLSVASKF